MPMILDSERLRAFVAVARARNFSRAAEELGKTQPSISQAIATLEREVGQPLFVREGRSTHLAPAGKLLLVHAEAIFAEMERAGAALAGLGELRQGELVVGTSDTLAYYLLPPVFAAFRARYPGVELRLDNRPSPATAAQVADRSVAVGIVTLPLLPDPRVTFEALVPHEDVVICPPGHPLARRRHVRVDELLAHPLLLLDRTTGARASLDAVFARARVRPNVSMEMSSVEVLKRLVELGFGVSIVPALAVARELRAGSLARVRVRGLSGGRSVGLLTPTAGPLAPAAAAFVQIARDVLRDQRRTRPRRGRARAVAEARE
jgi:DNA-binding transcriptional LysR family regulator